MALELQGLLSCHQHPISTILGDFMVTICTWANLVEYAGLGTRRGRRGGKVGAARAWDLEQEVREISFSDCHTHQDAGDGYATCSQSHAKHALTAVVVSFVMAERAARRVLTG